MAFLSFFLFFRLESSTYPGAVVGSCQLTKPFPASGLQLYLHRKYTVSLHLFGPPTGPRSLEGRDQGEDPLNQQSLS